jgi:hypothetical protein
MMPEQPEWNEAVTGSVAGVETLSDGTLRYEVSRSGELPSLSVRMWSGVEVRIELPNTAEIEVVRGELIPQLDALYVLTQPDVMSQDWRQGWVPVGGRWPDEIYLREQESLQLGELDGDPEMWGFPDRLEFEQAGSFPMHIAVRSKS